MKPFTEIAHDHVRAVLRPGDVAIDATVGNGHDTQFLAECVGPKGIVFGFDVQPDALERTAQRLAALNLHNVTLVHRSHAAMRSSLPMLKPGTVHAVMFNLGYLPGADKAITTAAESTIAAIRQTLELLGAGGIVTVLAYVGHSGGQAEADAVEGLLRQLPIEAFDVNDEAAPSNRTMPPRLFVVRRRE
jgi:predicted methyltransferase